MRRARSSGVSRNPSFRLSIMAVIIIHTTYLRPSGDSARFSNTHKGASGGTGRLLVFRIHSMPIHMRVRHRSSFPSESFASEYRLIIHKFSPASSCLFGYPEWIFSFFLSRMVGIKLTSSLKYLRLGSM